MNRVVLPLSRAAAAFVAAACWKPFGFARIEDYSRERLDRSGRWLRDLAALGQILTDHPHFASAISGDDGGRPIGRVAALLIGRGMPPHAHQEWITVARRVSVRELRRLIREAASRRSERPIVPENFLRGGPNGAERCADESDSAPRIADDGAPPAEPDEVERFLVRIQVPPAIRTAFDEALDLFRCVEGTEASVTSFIEALVAEGIGPDLPADADEAPLRRTDGRALVEDLLARTTGHWAHLPAPARDATEAAGAEADLSSFAMLSACAGQGDASALDRQLRDLISLQDRFSVRLGKLLMEMGDLDAWARLRFAGPGHYAEERLRITRSRAEARVRAARSLRRFPVLRRAYEQGLVGLEATLQIVRLLGDSAADCATEEAWVRHGAAATIKRVRDESRAIGRGILLSRQQPEGGRPMFDQPALGQAAPDQPPPDQPGLAQPPPDQPARGDARRDHLDSVDRCSPRPLGDAEWQASLRRAIGTARERLFRLGLLAAGAGHDAVRANADPAMTALPPSPDVFLRLRLPAEVSSSFLATIGAARRRLAREVDADPWAEAANLVGVRPSSIVARTFSLRCRRLPSWVGLLAMLEEFVDTWDRPHRATSPARDAVYIRDGWRCMAPGCTSRRNLEDHHIVYRSRGGGWPLSNRICLCRFHHQLGEHGSLAACSGRAPLAITWRLGRAGIGGRFRNELRLEGTV